MVIMSTTLQLHHVTYVQRDSTAYLSNLKMSHLTPNRVQQGITVHKVRIYMLLTGDVMI